MLDKNIPLSANSEYDKVVKFLEEYKDSIKPIFMFRPNGTVLISFNCYLPKTLDKYQALINEVTDGRYEVKQLHTEFDMSKMWEFKFSTEVKSEEELDRLFEFCQNRMFQSWEQIFEVDPRFYLDSEYSLKTFNSIQNVTIVDITSHHGNRYGKPVHWIVKKPKLTNQLALRFHQKIQQEYGVLLMDFLNQDKLKAMTPQGAATRFQDLSLCYQPDNNVMFLMNYVDGDGTGVFSARSVNDLLCFISNTLKNNQRVLNENRK